MLSGTLLPPSALQPALTSARTPASFVASKIIAIIYAVVSDGLASEVEDELTSQGIGVIDNDRAKSCTNVTVLSQ